MTDHIQHLDTLVEPAVPSEYMSDYAYLITEVKYDLLTASNRTYDSIKSRHYAYYSAISNARRWLISSGAILATEVSYVYKVYDEEAVDRRVEIAIEEIRSYLFSLPRIVMDNEPWEVI